MEAIGAERRMQTTPERGGLSTPYGVLDRTQVLELSAPGAAIGVLGGVIAGALLAISGLSLWVTLVAGVLLALTPIVYYSSVVVAPNALEIAAGIVLWLTLLRLSDEGEPDRPVALVWVSVVAIVLLGTLRLLGPLLLVLVLGTVLLFRGTDVLRTVARLPRRHLV